jgi:hypothetical protein
MIGQYLSNNNENCYSSVSPKILPTKRPQSLPHSSRPLRRRRRFPRLLPARAVPPQARQVPLAVVPAPVCFPRCWPPLPAVSLGAVVRPTKVVLHLTLVQPPAPAPPSTPTFSPVLGPDRLFFALLFSV